MGGALDLLALFCRVLGMSGMEGVVINKGNMSVLSCYNYDLAISDGLRELGDNRVVILRANGDVRYIDGQIGRPCLRMTSPGWREIFSWSFVYCLIHQRTTQIRPFTPHGRRRPSLEMLRYKP